MQSLWKEQEAGACANELELRVYSSRLLGRDPSLVLHGGGNTSVKITESNAVGEEEEILYIKGSGWDLETIEAEGFAPVRLQPMMKLAALDTLTDPQMVNELKTQLTRANAPAPSVETILHAALPFRYVDHTHADAVVTITNTADGRRRIEEIYGDQVVVIPYVMPGFDLARDVARLFAEQAGPQTIGMILMNHGVFSFADSAKESYERMIDLVDMAERSLEANNAWELELPVAKRGGQVSRLEVARLRQVVSEKAGRPMLLHVTNSARGQSFVQRDDLGSISQRGPVTPDHVIRTKAVPMLGRDVEGYAQAYKQYFATHEPAAKERKTILDPAPRVILDQDDWQMDTLIGVNIKKASPQLADSHINVSTYNKVVLLTGEVASNELRTLAGTTARNYKGVRQVYNELKLQGSSSLLARTNDSWLTTKVKSKLLANQEIDSSEIEVVTESGIVYLMGVVSRTTANNATVVASHTGGVEKVVRVFEYVD